MQEITFESLNTEDCIRVGSVYEGLVRGFYSEAECMDAYKKWLNQNCYLVLKRVVQEPVETKVDYIFTKTAKRGNDVYSYRLKQRFKQLGLPKNDLKKPQVEVNVEVYKNEIKSNAVFGTLTFDPKKISKLDAWDKIGEFWNKFMSRLKRKFQYLGDKGKYKLEEIYDFRSWESHKSGYPHIHFVLAFRNTTFLGFKRKNAEGKTEYRLNNQYRQAIKDCWEHGLVDLKIPISVETITGYISKYITKAVSLKDESGENDNLTLMHGWLFGKRTFSCSKYIKFREYKSPCLVSMTNSNKTLQMSLDGECLTQISYTYLGIATSISATKWYYEMEKLPENLELRRKKEYVGIRDMGFA